MSEMPPKHDLPANPARRRLLVASSFGGLAAAAGIGWTRYAQQARGAYRETIEYARAQVSQVMAAHRMSALSVALVEGERLVWREGFGRIDDSGRAPAPETLYAVGSISKVVAALAVMILVDRGQIDLDAPVLRYLRAFRMAEPGYERVTVRMLLAHSAGFPGTDPCGLFTTRPVPGYAEQVLQTLAGQRLKHVPGEMSVYCNDGFTLIEPLIAAVTGLTYAQFVGREILQRLGMKHSCFPQTVLPRGSYASVYVGDAPEPMECINGLAAGGLYSTPSDVARLAMLFIGRGEVGGQRVLSEASLHELIGGQARFLAFHPLPFPEVGLGWDGVRQAGLAAAGFQALHKNGQTAFYGSQLLVAPWQGLAVVLTGTSPSYEPDALAEDILLRALAEKGASREATGGWPGRHGDPGGEAGRGLDAATGVYAFNYGVWQLTAADDRSLVLARFDGDAWRPVEPRLVERTAGSGDWIGTEGRSYRLISREGREYLVQRKWHPSGKYATEELIGERVLAKSLRPPIWQARIGRRWLCVNDDPDSILLNKAGPVFTIRSVNELPGYILASYKGGVLQIADPASDFRADMAIRIPGVHGANIDDVLLEPRGGDEWLRFGRLLYRPLESVPALARGEAVVVRTPPLRGRERFGQWLRISASGEYAVSGVTHWKVFDGSLVLVESGDGPGTARVSEAHAGGGYLLFYGVPGQSVEVRPLSASTAGQG